MREEVVQIGHEDALLQCMFEVRLYLNCTPPEIKSPTEVGQSYCTESVLVSSVPKSEKPVGLPMQQVLGGFEHFPELGGLLGIAGYHAEHPVVVVPADWLPLPVLGTAEAHHEHPVEFEHGEQPAPDHSLQPD